MACRFEGQAPKKLVDFLKLVASNRGGRVEFFSNLDEALRWLGVAPAKPLPEDGRR